MLGLELGALRFFVWSKSLILKEVVGAKGFEPSTSWSRTMKLNSINASSGVAYGTRSVNSPPFVVPNLYLDRKAKEVVLECAGWRASST